MTIALLARMFMNVRSKIARDSRDVREKRDWRGGPKAED